MGISNMFNALEVKKLSRKQRENFMEQLDSVVKVKDGLISESIWSLEQQIIILENEVKKLKENLCQ
jgi:hypothetical protein